MRAATLYDPPEFKFAHPSAIELNSGLSAALGETLDRMISKEPDERPSTGRLIPFFEAACEMSPSGAEVTVMLRKSWRKLKKLWNK